MKTNIRFTAVFEAAEEGGYVGYVEEVPGINTQGETLDETKENLVSAMEDYFEAQRLLSSEDLKGRDVLREPIEVVS
jgi:predicted RNase H-like HicB family nuclease